MRSLDATLLPPFSRFLIIYWYYFYFCTLLSKANFKSFSDYNYSNVSMFITGWLANLIDLHLSANNKVEYVSYIF